MSFNLNFSGSDIKASCIFKEKIDEKHNICLPCVTL